jgi:hypothetical protein
MERLTLVSALLLLGMGCDPTPTLRPPGGGGWDAVGTASGFACAAHQSGRVECWGRTQYDEPRLGSLGPLRWSTLDVGESDEVCGVDDAGLVTCVDLLGEVGPSTPFEGGSRQVVIEGRLVCRLGVDGAVACEGTSALGGESPVAPTTLEVLSGSVSLTLSETTLCGLSAEGQGRCVRRTCSPSDNMVLSAMIASIEVKGASGTSAHSSEVSAMRGAPTSARTPPTGPGRGSARGLILAPLCAPEEDANPVVRSAFEVA